MADADFNMDFLERADDQYFDRLKRFKEARFRLGLRGGLMLVGLAVGAWFIFLSQGEVGYYFKKDAKVYDLGDVRRTDFDYSLVQALDTNDIVSFKNDVIVFDDLESEKFSFYFSPMTHFVVRTPRELPDKEIFRISDRIVELDPYEVGLVSQRKAFPADLAVAFDGQGRVVAGSDVPDWAQPIFQYMSNSSGTPTSEMRLFLDGDQPEDYAVFLYLIIGAAILMLGTIIFFLDALVRYNRAKHHLTRPPVAAA
jgi:hypothetical protein